VASVRRQARCMAVPGPLVSHARIRRRSPVRRRVRLRRAAGWVWSSSQARNRMGLAAHFLAPAHCSFASPHHLGFAQEEAWFTGFFGAVAPGKSSSKKLECRVLTRREGGAYIRPNTARRRFGVMARLRSSSLIVVVETPIRLGGSSFGGLPFMEGWGFGPGLFDR